MRVMVVALGLAAVALAGCSGSGNDSSVVINFGGSGSGDDTKRLACDATGQVVVNLGGTGRADVAVRDGDGRVIYDDTATGNGGYNEVEDLRGEPGEWRLDVTWTNVNGGLNVVLSC
jgi:hypothetical protein